MAHIPLNSLSGTAAPFWLSLSLASVKRNCVDILNSLRKLGSIQKHYESYNWMWDVHINYTLWNTSLSPSPYVLIPYIIHGLIHMFYSPRNLSLLPLERAAFFFFFLADYIVAL